MNPELFKFVPLTNKVSWRTIHSLDVAAVAARADVDALESNLSNLAFGDVLSAGCGVLYQLIRGIH
jgi:hypothetical protein